MGIINQTISKDEDGTVRHSFETEKGNVGTCTYNEKTSSEWTINDAISKAQEEALRKD